MKYFISISLNTFLLILIFFLGSCNKFKDTVLQKDAFINNPFSFVILKNYSDNFNTIGSIVNSKSTCPLAIENIADPSFCFLRTIEYDGLTIHIFSFDVLQSGTAEYILYNKSYQLRNGLTVGSTQEEVIKNLGKPYKIIDDLYIWESTDYHNYLVFTIYNKMVSTIRWHEEREPKYKDITVWKTTYK